MREQKPTDGCSAILAGILIILGIALTFGLAVRLFLAVAGF